MPATISMTRHADHRLVLEAQLALIAAGHPVHASGHFDRATYLQVCRLQGERGLPVTGIIDDATWQALSGSALRVIESEPEAVAEPSEPTIRPRKTGRKRRA